MALLAFIVWRIDKIGRDEAERDFVEKIVPVVKVTSLSG
jgi:hypothetical protein